jgi:hypothetical protein
LVALKHAETLTPILAFLEDIGLACSPGDVDAGSFLPGVVIRDGALHYETDRLSSPGDLLHEAGHLAAVPACWRGQIQGDVDASLVALADIHPDAAGVIHTDLFPIAWSFAAARHIGIDPACIFDAGGYGATAGGDPAILAAQLECGLFPGIMMLAQAGLCAAPPPFGDGQDPAPYPHMKRWLAA